MKTYNKFVLLLGTAFFCTACQTTGDPTQGGFWGWDSEKAKARQRELVNQANSADQATSNAQQNTALLTHQKREEQQQLRILEVQLVALVNENDKLDRELSELRKRNIKKANDIKAQLNELDEIKKQNSLMNKLISGRQEGGAIKVSGSIEDRRTLAKSLEEQNAKMHKAILLFR